MPPCELAVVKLLRIAVEANKPLCVFHLQLQRAAEVKPRSETANQGSNDACDAAPEERHEQANARRDVARLTRVPSATVRADRRESGQARDEDKQPLGAEGDDTGGDGVEDDSAEGLGDEDGGGNADDDEEDVADSDFHFFSGVRFAFVVVLGAGARGSRPIGCCAGRRGGTPRRCRRR